MAHMWFGNIVTMRWWDDLWLNEAFAEFACHWAAERATRHTEAWAGHLADERLRAYLADQGPASHPIHQPIADVAQAASIFDSITYPKGAAVLHQLMVYVGEERFRAGMAAYFARHAWGTTTLQDLVRSLAEAGGRDLDAWRAAWLETAGTDRFTLERDSRGDGGPVTLVSAAPPRPQVLAIGAYGTDGSATGGALERRALVRVEVTGSRTEVTGLPAGAELLLVNDENLTFAHARPAPGAEESLLRAAARLPTAVSRGVAVAAVWDMLVNGDATAVQAGRCVTAVLAAETSDAVIEPYLTLAADIAELWAPPAERPGLTAAVAETCRRLGQDPGRRRVALRGLARTATGPDDLAWLRAQAEGDVDLQWRVLVREAELGADTASRVAALLERDPDPDARMRALAVTAAAPDAGAKAEIWRKLVLDREVPVHVVRPLMDAFWRPGQDAVLAPYAELYLEALPALHHGGMIPAMGLTGRLFPQYAIDAAYIDRAQRAARDAVPVVRAILLERSDKVRRMLRSRGRSA